MPNWSHDRNGKVNIWLDVDYSDDTGWVFITTTNPTFITIKTQLEYTKVEGAGIIYRVKGFNNTAQARSFAIFYHKAKANGKIRRYRLD